MALAPTNFDNGFAVDDYTVPAFATITVGTETGNDIPVTIQLYADAAGTIELDNVASVFMYISDSAAGAGITAAGPDGGIAIGTDGDYIELVSNAAGYLVSEVDGDIDVVLTDATGTPTFYLVLLLPTGRRIVSSAIVNT